MSGISLSDSNSSSRSYKEKERAAATIFEGLSRRRWWMEGLLKCLSKVKVGKER